MEDPQALIERVYIEEFLSRAGHTLRSVSELPAAEAKQLMTKASTYAAVKLAELDARAHLVMELHGTSDAA